MVDCTLRPVAHGFQKRFWTAVSPRGLLQDDAIPVKAALDLVKAMHSWMFDHFFYTADSDPFHVLDGHALKLYNCAQEAAKRFQEDHQRELGPYVEAKLEFRHSDLLRAAHLAMRKNQFLYAYIEKSADKPARTKTSIYEFAFALHHWRRQIRLHFAFLRWMAREGTKQLAAAAEGASVDGPAGSYAAGEDLTGEDYFKYRILADMPPKFNTSEVRLKFRNMKRTKDS